VLFGDLHVHTRLSFDAYAFEVRNGPEEAYRFARGEAVTLPPLDAAGRGTRTVQLDRPLDFAAVTDHSEFLGEIEACTTPGSDGYLSAACTALRAGGNNGVLQFGPLLADPQPTRPVDVCGADGSACRGPAGSVWARVQAAAREADDRTSACRFTAFIGYEYTAATGFSTLHRNVIFANDQVPEPVTYFEQPKPEQLWRELRATCLDAPSGCDVLAIPHNPNESNGNLFHVEAEGRSTEEQAEAARLRAGLEPLVEIYQHKAASECLNGLGATLGAPDEQCAFEAPRRDAIVDCADQPGAGGVARRGCFAETDFVRGALLAGLAESERLGVNPFRLGILASTDTHNGTPGFVDEREFVGHRGTDDDTAALRLGAGVLTAGGIEFSPGGLVAVWAEENSRPSIFAALRRREVYGTSGPRLTVRLFGGWALPDGLCGDPQLVDKADAAGVPMGGLLPPRPPGGVPRFVVAAARDPGTPSHPSVALDRLQLIKGWRDQAGTHQKVLDVALTPTPATLDAASCIPSSGGSDTLCAEVRDPDFDPNAHAFYYVRVLESPTCRWSALLCDSLPPAERPASCSDPTVPRTIQERAWSSPIWYDPK
jgi:hypothetical protein